MLWGRRGGGEAKKLGGIARDRRQGLPRGDRRSAPRLDKVFRVYLEGDGGCGLGIARNISEGGLFVETRSPQPLGSQVRVTFPSDEGEMIGVAEVRYVCHLVGRSPAANGGPMALRGMGMRFLYFEFEPAARPPLH